MKKIVYVPKGRFASNATIAKRRELAKRLKRGEVVSVTSGGPVVAFNDLQVEDGRKLKVPEGKLADHYCSCCSGSGMKKCPRCDGTGSFNDGSKCYYCQGLGRVECTACDGTGVIRD